MANEHKTWRGAVEPTENAPNGNEYQAWRGAVEPRAPAVGLQLTVPLSNTQLNRRKVGRKL